MADYKWTNKQHEINRLPHFATAIFKSDAPALRSEPAGAFPQDRAGEPTEARVANREMRYKRRILFLSTSHKSKNHINRTVCKYACIYVK
jgi:hypothetical protein